MARGTSRSSAVFHLAHFGQRLQRPSDVLLLLESSRCEWGEQAENESGPELDAQGGDASLLV